MNKLKQLISDFWGWTGLPKEQWDKTDISCLCIEPMWFPGMEDVCRECFSLVNKPLSPDEMDDFLLSMAINSEDEDILDYCKVHASELFLSTIVSAGISFPQSETRWQIAELLRRSISDREDYLFELQQDSNEYVRRRANNVIEDIKSSSC